MFELIFGITWTMFSSFFIYGFYNLAEEVEVNGVVVSQAEFRQMLGPKIFMGIFLLVGIGMIISGLWKILKSISIHTNGIETIACIKEIPDATLYINDVPHYNAIVSLKDEMGNEVESISTNTFKRGEFKVGDHAKVKYYKGSVILIENMNDCELPYEFQNGIEHDHENPPLYHDYREKDSYVTINGEKHKIDNEFKF